MLIKKKFLLFRLVPYLEIINVKYPHPYYRVTNEIEAIKYMRKNKINNGGVDARGEISQIGAA